MPGRTGRYRSPHFRKIATAKPGRNTIQQWLGLPTKVDRFLALIAATVVAVLRSVRCCSRSWHPPYQYGHRRTVLAVGDADLLPSRPEVELVCVRGWDDCQGCPRFGAVGEEAG